MKQNTKVHVTAITFSSKLTLISIMSEFVSAQYVIEGVPLSIVSKKNVFVC